MKIACFGGLGVAPAAGLAGLAAGGQVPRSRSCARRARLADEAVGESVTAKWVAANEAPTLRTVTVVGGLLFLVTASHPTVRLLVKLGAAVVVVLGALEISARRRRPNGGGVP